MVLRHALWVCGTLARLATEAKRLPWAGVLGLTAVAAALVSVWFVVTAAWRATAPERTVATVIRPCSAVAFGHANGGPSMRRFMLVRIGVAIVIAAAVLIAPVTAASADVVARKPRPN